MRPQPFLVRAFVISACHGAGNVGGFVGDIFSGSCSGYEGMSGMVDAEVLFS